MLLTDDLFKEGFPGVKQVANLAKVASRTSFSLGKEVHVWLVAVHPASHLFRLLSTEERGVAARFKFRHDQERYIRAHGILRQILAGYTGVDPAYLSFNKTKYGKPVLDHVKVEETVHFNMTYSRRLICYIISKHSEVGIDVEYLSQDFDWGGIATTYFSPQELDRLENTTKKEQVSLFFKLWTAKEALLKCKGIGLNGVRDIHPEASDLGRYQCYTFCHEKAYQCSIAVASNVSRIQFYQFSG